MAISRDAITQATQSGTGSSLSYTHTIGSGSNGIVFVYVSAYTNSGDSPIIPVFNTPTFGGVSMTLVPGMSVGQSNGGGGRSARLYYLKNPTTGANTVSISTTASCHYGIGSAAISYFGVDQTFPIDTAGSANVDASTPATTASTSFVVQNTNYWVMGIVDVGPTSGAAGTNDWSGKFIQQATATCNAVLLDTNGADGNTGSRTFGVNGLSNDGHMLFACTLVPVGANSLLYDLIAYYKMQGNSNDSTANAYNGTDTSMSYSSTPPIVIGQYAVFNGSTSKISVPAGIYNLGTGVNPYTVNLWTKFTSGFTGGNLYMNWQGTAGGDWEAIRIRYDGTNFRFDRGRGGAIDTVVNTLVTPVANTWYMITCTYDGATMTIYISGGNSQNTSTTNSAQSANQGSIGQEQGVNFWNGDMDEMAWWSRALSSAEVSQLYNSGSAFQYPFLSGETVSVTDSTAVSDTPTIVVNAPPKSVSVSDSSAVSDTPTLKINSYISVTDVPGQIISGPNYPTLGANQTGVGTIAWTNPTNIEFGSGGYAFVTLNSCFPAGTLISTPSGLVKIEDIKIGDNVLSFSGDSISHSLVLRTSKHTANTLLRLRLEDGSILTTTPNHPVFFYDSSDFKEASLAQIGTGLRLISGAKVLVEDIERIEEIVDVYDLTVEGDHTYFANGIAVHNKP